MSDVINKVTLQYLKSVNTPDYPEDQWIINPVLPDCDPKYWKISGDTVQEMTTSEKANIDDGEIDLYKATKCNEIDYRTNELIGNGFEYDSHIFSLSQNAQRNWLDMKTFKDNTTYYPNDPIPITAQDVPEYLMLKSNIDDFYQIGRSIVKGYIDGGRDLKKQVKAASTIEEIDAVNDTRT